MFTFNLGPKYAWRRRSIVSYPEWINGVKTIVLTFHQTALKNSALAREFLCNIITLVKQNNRNN